MLGNLLDGTVLTGMGNSWGEQVFEMMGQTWGELAREKGWQRSLLESPPLSISPRMKQRAHHPQASRTP